MPHHIKSLLTAEQPVTGITVNGWVRTRRDSKDFSFIELNDGSCLANIQVIADETTDNYETINTIGTGAAITVTGDLIESPGKGQRWEIKASLIEAIGHAEEDFPFGPEPLGQVQIDFVETLDVVGANVFRLVSKRHDGQFGIRTALELVQVL